jgi:hypothetical protein
LHNHSHMYVSPVARFVVGFHPKERSLLESMDMLNKSTDLAGLYNFSTCRPLMVSMVSHISLMLALLPELTLNIWTLEIGS